MWKRLDADVWSLRNFLYYASDDVWQNIRSLFINHSYYKSTKVPEYEH